MRKDPTEFRERFKRWKAGEQVYDKGLPKFEDGKASYRYYQDGQGGWFRAANDDMTRTFEGLVVTPRKAEYTYTPKKIDNSEQAAKRRDAYNATRSPFTGLPLNQGLEIVSPEFDLIGLAPLAKTGAKMLGRLGNKAVKVVDNSAGRMFPTYDNVRKEIAKMKDLDDAWRAAHPEYEISSILKKPKLPDAYSSVPKNVQKYTIDPITQKLTTQQEADMVERMLYENKGFHGKQISNLHDNRARINGDFVEGVGRVYNIDDAIDYELAIQLLEKNAFGNRDDAIKFLRDPEVQSSSAGFVLPFKDKPIFISKSKLFSAREAQLGRKLTLSEAEDLYWKVVSHERHHAFDKIHNTPEGFDLNNLPLDDYFVKNGSDELAARGTQLKDMFGLVHRPLTAAHLHYARGKYFMDPSNINNNMRRFFNIITDYEKAAKWLNENATMLTVPIIGGTAHLLNKNTQNELRNK